MSATLDDSAVIWSAPPAERGDRPTLLLLHGYGSDERDLFGLVPHLPAEFVFAALRAPLTPPWPAPGHSWYPIEGLDGRRDEAVTAAARLVVDFIDANIAGPVGLLGFSQGGAVSLQALRLAPERISFVVNLAGYAVPGELDTDDALAAKRPPVFWGRGSHDDVIPAALVEHSTQWLPTRVDLSGRVYPGLTHSVSQEELDDVRAFLTKRLVDLAAPAA